MLADGLSTGPPLRPASGLRLLYNTVLGLLGLLRVQGAAQAAAGRMLYNTAEMDRGPLGEGDTVAILEGTQLCCTRQLRDLLHCLGGIPVLLPLFAQLGAARAPLHHPHLHSRGLPESAIERGTPVTMHAGVGDMHELQWTIASLCHSELRT